jgi:hypothetical protein
VNERSASESRIARRLAVRIGREPPAEPGAEEEPADREWPPEELLVLHDRHDVSHVEVRVRNPLLGWLLTPIRRMALRPMLDFAGRQSEVNALTAKVLSELTNHITLLQASESTRRAQDDTIRGLKRRVRALESALREAQAVRGAERRDH